MNGRKMGKESAKIVGRSAMGFVGMSAALAQHGLTATDSVFGGYVNQLSGAFAGGMGKTPIKDVSLKAAKGLLGKVGELAKSAGKKIKEL